MDLPPCMVVSGHAATLQSLNATSLAELVLAECSVETFMKAFEEHLSRGWLPFSTSLRETRTANPLFLIHLVDKSRTDILWALLHNSSLTISDGVSGYQEELVSFARLMAQSPNAEMLDLLLDFMYARSYMLPDDAWFKIAYTPATTQLSRETIMEEVIPYSCFRWVPLITGTHRRPQWARDGEEIQNLSLFSGREGMVYLDVFNHHRHEVMARHAIRRSRRERRLVAWKDPSTPPPTTPSLEARERMRLRHWSEVYANGNPNVVVKNSNDSANNSVLASSSSPPTSSSTSSSSASTSASTTSSDAKSTAILDRGVAAAPAIAALLRNRASSAPFGKASRKAFISMFGVTQSEYTEAIRTAATVDRAVRKTNRLKHKKEESRGSDVAVDDDGKELLLSHMSVAYCSNKWFAKETREEVDDDEDGDDNDEEEEEEEDVDKDGDDEGALGQENKDDNEGKKNEDKDEEEEEEEEEDEDEEEEEDDDYDDDDDILASLADLSNPVFWDALSCYKSSKRLLFTVHHNPVTRGDVADDDVDRDGVHVDSTSRDPFLSMEVVNHLENMLRKVAKSLDIPARVFLNNYVPVFGTCVTDGAPTTIALLCSTRRLQILAQLFREDNFGVPISAKLFDYALECYLSTVSPGSPRGTPIFLVLCTLLTSEKQDKVFFGPVTPWAAEWASGHMATWLGALSHVQLDYIFHAASVCGADWLVLLMAELVPNLSQVVTLNFTKPTVVRVANGTVKLAAKGTRLSASTLARVSEKHPSLASFCAAKLAAQSREVKDQANTLVALRAQLGSGVSDYRWSLAVQLAGCTRSSMRLRFTKLKATASSSSSSSSSFGAGSSTNIELRLLIELVIASNRDARWRNNRVDTTLIPTQQMLDEEKTWGVNALRCLYAEKKMDILSDIDVLKHILTTHPSLIHCLFTESELLPLWNSKGSLLDAVKKCCEVLVLIADDADEFEQELSDELMQLYGSLTVRAMELGEAYLRERTARAATPSATASEGDEETEEEDEDEEKEEEDDDEKNEEEDEDEDEIESNWDEVADVLTSIPFLRHPAHSVRTMRHVSHKICNTLDRLSQHPLVRRDILTPAFARDLLTAAAEAGIVPLASWAFQRLRESGDHAKAVPYTPTPRDMDVFSETLTDKEMEARKQLLNHRYPSRVPLFTKPQTTVLHGLCMSYWMAKLFNMNKPFLPSQLAVINHVLDLWPERDGVPCFVPDKESSLTPLMLAVGFDSHGEAEKVLVKLICLAANGDGKSTDK